jgi:hypothetical protein
MGRDLLIRWVSVYMTRTAPRVGRRWAQTGWQRMGRSSCLPACGGSLSKDGRNLAGLRAGRGMTIPPTEVGGIKGSRAPFGSAQAMLQCAGDDPPITSAFRQRLGGMGLPRLIE